MHKVQALVTIGLILASSLINGMHVQNIPLYKTRISVHQVRFLHPALPHSYYRNTLGRFLDKMRKHVSEQAPSPITKSCMLSPQLASYSPYRQRNTSFDQQKKQTTQREREFMAHYKVTGDELFLSAIYKILYCKPELRLDDEKVADQFALEFARRNHPQLQNDLRSLYMPAALKYAYYAENNYCDELMLNLLRNN